MTSNRRYLLIGTGVAAIAAAQAIRAHDPQGQILILSDDAAGYYSRPGLAYYLSGELDEKQLFPFTEQEFRSLNIKRMQAQVTKIDPQAHQVSLHNQQIIPYDRLLIATGSVAASLPLPNNDLPGVVKLDHLDDARAMLKFARRNRSAVVVGGGITALEIAEGFLARGVKTHYLMRGERYWSNVLDAAESRIIEQRLAEHGLIIHHQTEIVEIVGRGGKLTAVRTQQGQVITCDILAVAIGVVPRKQLAQTAGLQVDRGILVNEYLQTSAADIFAAGDVAQVFDPATGQTMLDTLWTPSRRQGETAGLNMAGIEQAYYKTPAFNITRLAGITTTIIGSVGEGKDPDLAGIARGDSETWRFSPDTIPAQVQYEINRLRVMVGTQTLRGAVIMGDQSLSRKVQQMILTQADISPIRQQLLQPNAPVAQVLTDFQTRQERD